MTKFKAALIHLSLSALVIGLFFLTLYSIWYPQPFFAISGVVEPLKLLVMVDVIVGPLLTFVVYKKGKKTLKLDLSVIVLMQIFALAYGANTIYQGRPSLLVFNNGQFHYMAEKFAKNQELKVESLKPSLFSKPKLAYAANIKVLDIYNAYAEFVEIDQPELMLLPHSLSLENMKAKFKNKEAEIDELNEKYQQDAILFFILDKQQSQYYVVFSTTKNQIIDYLKF